MTPDFNKNADGLLPAVIQHADTLQVLMVGYMNAEALETTRQLGRVTFFSRSKNRLWTKGERSGHFLQLADIRLDCDADALLVKARPLGPTCHTGARSCFQEQTARGFLYALEQTIADRIADTANESSYTQRLYRSGLQKIAQKVGEEAVETILEARSGSLEHLQNEAADLLYHLLLLLQARGSNLEAVEAVLMERRQS